MQFGAVWFSSAGIDTIGCSLMQFGAVLCCLVQLGAVRLNLVQFDAVRFSLIQFGAQCFVRKVLKRMQLGSP